MSRRKRTITWEDPAPAAKAAKNMSGIEFIKAMAGREIPFPPMADLMGLSIEPGKHRYNPIGSVHGGLACTIFDSAMGDAPSTRCSPPEPDTRPSSSR